MKVNTVEYLRAEQKLNATVLRGETTLLPLEIFNVRIVEQAKERVSQTYTPYMHQHTYFEMHVPIVGTQTYQLRDETISVKSNELVVFSPNTLHSIPYSSDDLQKFSLSYTLLEKIDESDFSWVGKELANRSYFMTRADPWYATVFRRIFREADMAQPGWTTLVINMVSQIIIDIARENLPAEKKLNSAQGLQRKRIESIERFIMDNISASITNQMVAEHMFLSIRQLDRVTLAERGVTLKSLIDAIKMREARRLLGKTNMEQKEISTTLGFSDVSSFNRYFRRFENLSPGAYRSKVKMEVQDNYPPEENKHRDGGANDREP